MEESQHTSPQEWLRRSLKTHSQNFVRAYAIGVLIGVEIALFFMEVGQERYVSAVLIVLAAVASSGLVIRLRKRTRDLNAAMRRRVFVSLDVQNRLEVFRSWNVLAHISGALAGIGLTAACSLYLMHGVATSEVLKMGAIAGASTAMCIAIRWLSRSIYSPRSYRVLE